MALKPNGSAMTIREQIIKDDASGLTLQFAVVASEDAPYRLRIFGDALPFGNREILFDRTGAEAGAGTSGSGACSPSWLRPVEVSRPANCSGEGIRTGAGILPAVVSHEPRD